MIGLPSVTRTVPAALLLTLCAAAGSALTATPLEGHWRFVDDGTVVEFAPCADAMCATVRRPPPKSAKPAEDPKCGQVLIGGIKPDSRGGRYIGWAADPADNKRYSALLEPDGERQLRLVVRAMGGLATETYTLQAVQTAVEPCSR